MYKIPFHLKLKRGGGKNLRNARNLSFFFLAESTIELFSKTNEEIIGLFDLIPRTE